MDANLQCASSPLFLRVPRADHSKFWIFGHATGHHPTNIHTWPCIIVAVVARIVAILLIMTARVVASNALIAEG